MTLLQRLMVWRDQRRQEAIARDATELVREILAHEPQWREQLAGLADDMAQANKANRRE